MRACGMYDARVRMPDEPDSAPVMQPSRTCPMAMNMQATSENAFTVDKMRSSDAERAAAEAEARVRSLRWAWDGLKMTFPVAVF